LVVVHILQVYIGSSDSKPQAASVTMYSPTLQVALYLETATSLPVNRYKILYHYFIFISK